MIASYDRAASVGVAMKVALTITGLAYSARVWLNDNVSAADIAAPEGFRLTGSGHPQLTLLLVPHQIGTWHVWASAVDAKGCQALTGVIRDVVVK